MVHQHCWRCAVLVLNNFTTATSCKNTLSPGQVVVLMTPQALLDTTSPANIGINRTMFTDEVIVLKISFRFFRTLLKNTDTVTFYLEKNIF